MKGLLVCLFLCLSTFQVAAEGQVLTIEGARIRGNQELPTVLYVVPWQPAEVKQLETPETSFAIHQPVKMLERIEFKRMLSYHEAFLKEAPVKGSNSD